MQASPSFPVARKSPCEARLIRCAVRLSVYWAGLALAIVLVYALIVVNFQSWLDPFIIIDRAAGGYGRNRRLCSVCMEYDRQCSCSHGIDHERRRRDIETAFQICQAFAAKERLADGMAPDEAALEAGFVRFRPVIMTALAMIIGMVPMSLGMGEGGKNKNAPLGRAVIGGLMFATVATLLFVPTVFSLLHRRRGN